MQLFLLEICQGMLHPGAEGWEADLATLVPAKEETEHCT